jgi:VWFA-related protein
VNPTRLSLAVLIALLMLGTPLLSAQEEEESTIKAVGGLAFIDEISLTLVNIDVFVRDSDGKPVTGLSLDDFKVFQDGEQREITNFATFSEEYFNQRLPEPAIPALVPTPVVKDEPEQSEPEPIYMVLYVDNENLRQFDRNRVLREVREFVRQSLLPGVQMMVVSYQRSFKVEVPFTNDQTAILEALRRQRKVVGARGERDTQRGRLLREIRQMYADREGVNTTQGRYYNELYQSIRSYADENSNNLDFTLQAIRGVGTMVAGLPGRKYLVYISNGLPMVPGKDLMYEFSTINQDSPLLSMVAPYNRKYRYDALASAANAQGLTFYTIDASGVSQSAEVSAEHSYSGGDASFYHAQNHQSSLLLLAERTGGMAIVNTNNFAGGLEKIKADLFTYYSLGYTINASGADKVHRIKVELPGHPKHELRYRRTFVERSLESTVQDEVMSGLMFDLDKNPMQIKVDTGEPAPAAEGRWVLPVSVSFPMWALAMLPQGDDYVGQAVLFVAARDTRGKQSDIQRQNHEMRVPKADYETRSHESFVIDLNLLMEPGSFRIAVGLLDQVTRQASYQSMREYIREAEQ